MAPAKLKQLPSKPQRPLRFYKALEKGLWVIQTGLHTQQAPEGLRRLVGWQEACGSASPRRPQMPVGHSSPKAPEGCGSSRSKAVGPERLWVVKKGCGSSSKPQKAPEGCGSSRLWKGCGSSSKPPQKAVGRQAKAVDRPASPRRPQKAVGRPASPRRPPEGPRRLWVIQQGCGSSSKPQKAPEGCGSSSKAVDQQVRPAIQQAPEGPRRLWVVQLRLWVVQ